MYDLAAFKRAIDPVIAELYDTRAARVHDRAQDPAIAALLAHGREIVLAGGKRIRPYLAYLMYASLTDDPADPPLPAFASLELFHAFALVHDDVMDESPLRHGVASAHAFVQAQAGSHPAAARVGEGQAILLGDLLFSWSASTLAETLPDTTLRQTLNVLSDMADAVVAGQMLDVALMARATADEETIARKTLLKTAQYTFVHPLRIGAAVAGVSPSVVEDWTDAFGQALGMAFQIQDDLLDARAEAAAIGKRVLNDVREGQHTLLSAYVRSHASVEDQRVFDAAFGAGDAVIDESAVRAVLERSGAFAHAEALIAERLAAARVLLTESPFPSERQAPWEALIDLLQSRSH